MERDDGIARIDRVSAYRIAIALSGDAVRDAAGLRQQAHLAGIAPQLVRAAGSIAANVAEGWAKRSPKDRIRFYEYALGSADETASWYRVVRSHVGEDQLRSRLAHRTDIRRLLVTMIRNERNGTWGRRIRR